MNTVRCGRCGQELFQSEADKAAGRWNTVYRDAVDPYQCPDFDAGIVINDGHYPAEEVN
jgi:hypothetical protein